MIRSGLAQALSAAIIAFAGLYLRSRYSIRPDAVYRKALVQLNTNPAILEVCHLCEEHTEPVVNFLRTKLPENVELAPKSPDPDCKPCMHACGEQQPTPGALSKQLPYYA